MIASNGRSFLRRYVQNGRCLLIVMLITALLLPIAAASPCLAGTYTDPGFGVAIDKDSSVFVGWATGYENYDVGLEVDPVWQTPEKALGKAEGTSTDIVCLGRGGEITLTFDTPITNGPGWDFAVFENSFNDTFLELAYVEVSSDGSNFFRFDNLSETKDPVDAFGTVVATDITGYGGRYRQGLGTSFDLDQDYFFYTDDLSGLDRNRITHVKIVDIVGDGSALDSLGRIIYDPYPTTGSAGFDLDAVGVIHAAPVPVPAAVWLLASGLLGLIGIRRRGGNASA